MLTRIYEQVLWLDLSVHNVRGMAPVDGKAQLVDVTLHQPRRQAVWLLLEHLEKVPLDELKNKIQFILSPECLEQ